MTSLPFSLATARPPQIGVIVLQADETIEADLRHMLPAPTEALVSRVPSDTHVSPETLGAMDGKLTAAARLMPQGARFSAMGYGCTSATAQLGADNIATQITAGIGAQVPVSDPLTACLAACAALGLKRIALVSPYVAAVSDRLVDALEAGGPRVTDMASFDIDEEAKVARVDAPSLLQAVVQTGRGACDGVFLSCTNLRTLDVIAQAEAALNKPVLSSNQALAWHLAALAGVPAAIPGRLGQMAASL